MKKLIIMQGVPGSGKSSFVASLLKEANDNKETIFVFSADHFFTDALGVYHFDPSLLGEAHKQCKRGALEAMMAGDDVIVDNTNTTVLEMAFYVELAATLDYECILYTVHCDDLQSAADRNKHCVPYNSIQRMDNNIRACRIPHYWNLTHAKVYGEKFANGNIGFTSSILKRS